MGRSLLIASLALGLPAGAAHADTGDAPLATATPESRERAIGCLAAAIAYEAAWEPVEGRQAVAEVVLNRLRDPAFPKTVCGVVFAGSERRTGCQFSFTCDGSLRRRLPESAMAASREIAAAALDGLNPLRVAGATHYHADYVSPYWAPSLVRLSRIGAHIFYRVPGAKDQGAAAVPYVARGEPLIHALAFLGEGAAVPAPRAPTSRPAERRPPEAFAPWGLPAPALAATR